MPLLEAFALSGIVFFGVHSLVRLCYDCAYQWQPRWHNTGDAFQTWYATDMEDSYTIVALHHTHLLDIVAPIVELTAPQRLVRQRPMTRSLARALAAQEAANTAVCAICLEDLKDCQAIREISVCSHRYCSACIQIWLSKNRTCPLCNRDAFCLVTAGE